MASAAYWIGSAANQVIVERTAQVGSIGVLYMHYDWSKYDAEMGLKVTVITSGKYKAIGNNAEPLSDDARAIIQAEMDQIYDLFIETVARNRGVSTEKVLVDMADGRVFIGQQAVEAGLADQTGSFEDALEAAVDLIPAQSGLYYYQSRIGATAPGKEHSAMSGKQEFMAPKTTGELTAMFPELAAGLRQEGADSVDAGMIQD